MTLSRRTFLRTAFYLSTGTLLYCNGFFSRDQKQIPKLLGKNNFPILPIQPGDLKGFSGDNPSKAHPILWNKQDYLKSKGGLPQPTEKSDLVIVGSGMAGLCAAYQLKNLKPIILEQAPRLGGNSKGEEWDGMRYSIGAAYITLPDEGSEIMKMLIDLGLDKIGRKSIGDEGETLLKNAKLIHNFWDGVTDPKNAEAFKKIKAKLAQVYETNYPNIPPNGTSTKENTYLFDQMSFYDWLIDALYGANREETATLPADLEEYLDEYCWSSLGGTMHEISAAQALSFITADLQGSLVFPGGNSSITHALAEHLEKNLPQGNIRANSLVVDVTTNSDGCLVSFEDGDGNFKSIQTKKCIFAAPKFIAKRVINNLPQEQIKAMSEIRYRSYLVANLLINQDVDPTLYDVYRLNPTPRPPSVKDDSDQRPYTDIVFGNWAANNQMQRSVLTLYKGFPYDGARASLYADDSFERAKKQFEESLPEIFTALKIDSKNLVDLRITRWGHPIPLGAVGLIREGVLERAAQPIDNKIFFANQDNWANPCFETAFLTALDATRSI